jgi:hypothetical protein
MSQEATENKKRSLFWQIKVWGLPVLMLLTGTVLYYCRDEELRPVDHLAPVRRLAPCGPKTCWGELAAFVKKLPTVREKYLDRIKEHRRYFAEPPQEVPEVPGGLVLNEEQWRALEAILGRKDWLTEQVMPAKIDYSKPWPKILSGYLSGTMHDAVVRRDVPVLMRVLRAGQQMTRKYVAGSSEAADLHNAFSWMHVETLLMALLFMELDEQVLREVAGMVAEDPFTVEDAREALRRHHTELWQAFQPVGPKTFEHRGWFSRLRYKENASLNLLTELAEQRIETVLTVPLKEIKPHRLGAPQFDGLSDRWGMGVGGHMVTSSLTLEPDVGFRAELVQWRALRVVVALYRFHRARGKVPATLDELVPEFLAEVPRDPFDLAPLRWDAAARLVISVGTEGSIGVLKRTKEESGTPGYYTLVLGSMDNPALRFRLKSDGPDYGAAAATGGGGVSEIQ